MKLIQSVKETINELQRLRGKGLTIGFVPTMGALHEGHLVLVRRSILENDITICSIFVNPKQFNNQDDLGKYPRMLEKDAELLEKEGCHILFAPSEEEMYPGHEKITMKIDFGVLETVLEGKFRPGHFKGVAIVVKKLFEITGPTRAYFGKKDYQQLLIIRHMVRAMGLPVQIISCETVREPDGLAMSSRNLRLTKSERKLAPKIYQVLCKVREKSASKPVRELKEWAIKKIQENPELRVEYFEIADKESLLPLVSHSLKGGAVALTAVYLGDVRLIDNVELF